MSHLGSPPNFDETPDGMTHIRPRNHTRLLSYTGPPTQHLMHPKSPSFHSRSSSTPDPLLQLHHRLGSGTAALQGVADSPFFVGSDIVYGVPEPPPNVDWGFLDLDTIIDADKSTGGPGLRSDSLRVSMTLHGLNTGGTPGPHHDSHVPDPSSNLAHLYRGDSTTPSRPASAVGRLIQRPNSSNAVSTDGTNTSGPDSGGSSPGSGQQRTRAQQACENCRSRKAKCSGEQPVCQRCEVKGVRCEYRELKVHRGPSRSGRKKESANAMLLARPSSGGADDWMDRDATPKSNGAGASGTIPRSRSPLPHSYSHSHLTPDHTVGRKRRPRSLHLDGSAPYPQHHPHPTHTTQQSHTQQSHPQQWPTASGRVTPPLMNLDADSIRTAPILESAANAYRAAFHGQLRPQAWQYMAPPFQSSPLATPPSMIAAPVPHHPPNADGVHRGISLGEESGYFDAQYPQMPPTLPLPPPQQLHNEYHLPPDIYEQQRATIVAHDESSQVGFTDYQYVVQPFAHHVAGELDVVAAGTMSLTSASQSHSPMVIMDGDVSMVDTPSPFSGEVVVTPGWTEE